MVSREETPAPAGTSPRPPHTCPDTRAQVQDHLHSPACLGARAPHQPNSLPFSPSPGTPHPDCKRKAEFLVPFLKCPCLGPAYVGSDDRHLRSVAPIYGFSPVAPI